MTMEAQKQLLFRSLRMKLAIKVTLLMDRSRFVELYIPHVVTRTINADDAGFG